MSGQGKTSKRNRILAAALGFVATAGAFVAFAQTEKARDWKHFRGKVVVTGTLDVGKTVEAFPSGASEPESVWFRKSDGTAASYQYDLLSADDKKAVAVALDLDVNSEDDARSANDARSASDVNSRSMRPEAKCVRRAVLVGINDYARFSDLRFAGADVELMRSRLVELGFAPENIVVLTTQAGREDSRFAPNKTNIELELKRILEESGPDDMIFVMFTGHGFQTESYGGYAPYVGFAPSDAAPNRATVVDFASTVSLSKLFADLEACEARFKWVLVDACRENLAEDSPLAGGSAASKSLARSKALRKLEAPPGVAILQSCADGEFSWERAGHGIFTRTFVESLTELGDANEDGVVTFLEAAERTMTEVKRETSNRGEYDTTQTPYLSGSMTRFVLADVNTAKAKERWRAAVEAREKGDYTTARKEIDAALALMPNKPEYETEKRAIEAFASAEEKAKSDAERKAKEEATARAEAERKAEEARRQAQNAGSTTGRTSTTAQAQPRTQPSSASSDEESYPGDWSDAPKAGTLKTLKIGEIEYRFHYCPSGTFTMGSPESESMRAADEGPQRKITVNGFWTLETEVTQAMWEAAMEENPSWFCSSGGGSSKVSGMDTSDFPVERVSWNECQEFIDKLNAAARLPEGFKLRLPTEAEWEYACRAGTTTAYFWGDSLNGDKANCDGNYPCGTSTKGEYLGRTTKVRSYGPNPWGLYDMHGNVYEWCEDVYAPYNTLNSVQNSINVTSKGSFRVLRGGSWINNARNCRSADRNSNSPAYRCYDCGFRLVLGREL